MKGFLYLVETAVAAVLIAVILSSVFAAQYSGSDWTRADLIGVGNNLFDAFGESISLTLNSTQIFDEIDMLKPANVKYTFRFRGIPKSKIIVGTNSIFEVSKYLEPSYLNGRVIEYDIYGFNPGDSLNKFDIVVLSDYNGYNLTAIQEFSKNKVVIGIEDELTGAEGFLNYFSINRVKVPVKPTNLEFNSYNDLTKYFLGIGFIVKTRNTTTNGLYGTWKIKNNNPAITISAYPKMCIDEGGVPTCTPDTEERKTFSYDGNSYFVKDINYGDFGNSWVRLSIKETNFYFADGFTDGNIDSTEFSDKLIGDNNCAAMTKYNNRIWISKPDNYDTEYKALVQAAVASSVMDWYIETPDSEKTVEVSKFLGLCCDIPETAEISLVLWYVF